jgi:hypothetical protein
MYEIVEDCSPFYIKFKFNGLSKFLDDATLELEKNHKLDGQRSVYQRKIALADSQYFLDQIPFSKQIKFQSDRLAYIITKPGTRHNIHLDVSKISFNFGIQIKDDCCITNWYDIFSVTNSYKTNLGLPLDRYIIDLNESLKNPITPIKTFTQKEGECILFNSDIYHDFDNSSSVNNRIILTLRPVTEFKLGFFAVRKLLFNF